MELSGREAAPWCPGLAPGAHPGGLWSARAHGLGQGRGPLGRIQNNPAFLDRPQLSAGTAGPLAQPRRNLAVPAGCGVLVAHGGRR